MTRVLGAVRRKILTPSFSEAAPEKRGFHVKDRPGRDLLEKIGVTFLSGFSRAVHDGSPDEAAPALDEVPARFRGFAYEGAAMGFAVLDALSPGAGGRFARLLSGRGRDHDYMVHVGLGWAMARTPRFRWPTRGVDPLLRWLVLDGFGFHQAYFRTDRVVTRRSPHPALPWPRDRHAWYGARALDQGVGRALWFAGGADPDVVADLVERFDPRRRPDLFSGVGLAATYAGGADEDELLRLRRRAAGHLPHVAQGCAFAAEARRRAGLEVPHTDVASRVLCELSAREAARLAVETRPAPAGHDDGDVPAYEVWRCRIADQFVSLGRS